MGEGLTAVTNTGDKLLVSLGSVLDAPNGAAIYAELGQLVEEPRTVALAGELIERVDAAGLQVLVAFVLARGRNRRAVEWANASAALRQGAALLGLSDAMGLK